MRRTDREITDTTALTEIIRSGMVMQIAFIDNGEPYIVTLNYGFTRNEFGNFRFYFHSADEGRKIDIVKKNPRVCFTIAICDPFTPGEKACNYGMQYRSVVGYGNMRIVEKYEERIYGLNLLMEQYTGKNTWDYDEDMVKRTAVTCLEVTQIAGKQKK